MPLTVNLPISSEFLIVGEGNGDSALVKYLCADRNITHFQIEDSGGASQFEKYITGLKTRRGFDSLKLIVIVADCDDGADASFDKIRRQLKAADMPYPNRPRVFAKRASGPATYVIMVPFDGENSLTGALESLLLPAAIAHHPGQVHCMEQWRDCVGAPAQSASHRDKMLLRALLAAAHPDDPNISLAYALSPTKNLIPLAHSSFDALAALLQSIPDVFRDA